MNQTFSRFLLAAVFAAACPVARAQNLVSNPSFESGSFTNGVGGSDGYMVLNVGDTNIANWAIINSEIAWGRSGNPDSIVPHSGNFFLDLEGTGLYSTPYGGVTQTVATTPGQTYHFSFYLGTQQSTRNNHGPISVSATADSLTQSFTFDPTGDNTQWGQFGFDFTATGVSTPISIVGTYTNDGAYIGLDDVSVVSTAPEPSTTALFVGGVLVAGAICYRRRTVQGRSEGGLNRA